MHSLLLIIYLTLFGSILANAAETLPKKPEIATHTSPDASIGVPDNSELILNVQVEKIILGNTFALKSKDTAMIGMQSVFSVLDFPIIVNTRKKKAEGWFINEDYIFKLTTTKVIQSPIKVKSNGNIFTPKNEDILFLDDDIYVRASILFEWINIKYEINYNTLTIMLYPDEKLPIQKRLERKNKKTANSRHNISAQHPQKHISYNLWNFPFLDIATRYNTNGSNYKSYGYSVIGGGDLSYMTARYYASGDENTRLRNFRLTLSRQSIENKLLGSLKSSYISIGDISPTPTIGLSSVPQEVGVRISNRPVGRSTNLNTTDFTGDVQPGWDVELYRNGLLIGSQTAGENGRYEFFNMNILYGKNIFKLLLHGPQGQRREKIETIILDQGALLRGKTIYDISLSKQDSQLFYPNDLVKPKYEYNRFIVSLSHGLTRSMSFQAAFSRYNFRDGSPHYFAQSNIKLLLFNALLDMGITKDVRNGKSYKATATRSFGLHSILLSNITNSPDYKTNSDSSISYLLSNRAQLSGPLFSLLKLKTSYSLAASDTEYLSKEKVKSYNANFSAGLGRINLTNNVRYSTTNYIDKKSTRSINGESQSSIFISRINFRLGAIYTLKPENRTASLRTTQGIKSITSIYSLNMGAAWYITSKLNTQLSARYLPETKRFSKLLSITWRAKHFTLSSNATYIDKNTYTAYIGVNFGLGYDKNTSTFKMTPERIANTGAVSALVFLDDNYNGKHDKNEAVYKGAKLQAIQARKISKTSSDGSTFMTGLPADRVTDIQLDITSLEDPFLVPSTPAFSFLPRPGLIETMNIPLVTSGEIEGTIYIENTTRIAGNIPLILTNIKTREKRTEKSAFDGFYLFSSVPPGQYLIAIDKYYLKRSNYGAKKPMPRVVTIFPTGNIEMGNDFTIYPLRASQ